MRRLLVGPVGLAVAFLIVHVVLGAVDLFDGVHQPAGDVTGVYRFWMDAWRDGGGIVGVDTPWVYPLGALPPMIAAFAFGDGPYLLVWLLLVTVLDAVAFVPLAARHPRLAWWWLAFTACLGPIALVRVDTVALPVVILGVLLVASRPGIAAALLTLGAWIKVWPAVLVLAMLVALKRRAAVLAGGAAVSVVVAAVAVALGAARTLFSFIPAQAGRGLQIEAPVAAPWLWDAASGRGGTSIYYDHDLLTYQVRGDGVAAAAAAMTPLLLAVIALLCLLGLLARRRGADAGAVLALVALGLVTAVIAINKVGSPQYFTWFVGPVLLGLLLAPGRFRGVAIFALPLAALTQLVYPWFYDGVLALEPLMLGVLTLRNLLEVALLGWTVRELLRLRPESSRPLPRTSVYPSAVAARRIR